MPPISLLSTGCVGRSIAVTCSHSELVDLTLERLPSILRFRKKDSDFFDALLEGLEDLKIPENEAVEVIHLILRRVRQDQPEIRLFLYQWHLSLDVPPSKIVCECAWKDSIGSSSYRQLAEVAVSLIRSNLSNIGQNFDWAKVPITPGAALLALELKKIHQDSSLYQRVLKSDDWESKVTLWENSPILLKESPEDVLHFLHDCDSIRIKQRFLAILRNQQQIPLPDVDDWDIVLVGVARQPEVTWAAVDSASNDSTLDSHMKLRMLVEAVNFMPELMPWHRSMVLEAIIQVVDQISELESHSRKKLVTVLQAFTSLRETSSSVDFDNDQVRKSFKVAMNRLLVSNYNREYRVFWTRTLVAALCMYPQIFEDEALARNLATYVKTLNESEHPEHMEALEELLEVCLSQLPSLSQKECWGQMLEATSNWLDEVFSRQPRGLEAADGSVDVVVSAARNEERDGNAPDPTCRRAALELFQMLGEVEPLSEDEMWDFPMDCYT